MSHLIATFFGIGHLRPAPGTWGSLAALPVALALHLLGGPFLLLVALGLVIFAGHWAIRMETAGKDNHDPSEIVIDEVAGQWVALLPVSFGAWHVGAAVTALWPGWVAAFVLFRLFDIWKPWLVGRADQRGDAWGVIEDDLWAGLFAAAVTILLAGLSHGVLR